MMWDTLTVILLKNAILLKKMSILRPFRLYLGEAECRMIYNILEPIVRKQILKIVCLEVPSTVNFVVV
jgi:hypothetical protein